MSAVLSYLRDLKRDAPAEEIARALGMRREDVYLELVPAESRGQARIVSTWPTQDRRVMLWGAL